MKIIVTGSSGLVGTELISFLKSNGHSIKKLIREKKEGDPNVGYWDPDKKILNADELVGYDALINLSGENISSRWTEAKKERIYSSRINATKLLVDTLTSMTSPPPILINASAIGFYGNRGEEDLDEKSSQGTGFLSKVCFNWEQTAQKAAEKNIRVVSLRIGMVLSEKGGALKKMLIPFKFGLGGRLGQGQQYMSWVTLNDLVNIIQFTLFQEALKGPVNAVAPNPVKNEQFTNVLSRVLARPAFLHVPEFIAQGIFGEMANELLLASIKVHPTALLSAGYVFKDPQLELALKDILK